MQRYHEVIPSLLKIHLEIAGVLPNVCRNGAETQSPGGWFGYSKEYVLYNMTSFLFLGAEISFLTQKRHSLSCPAHITRT
jgi:hypothetical protein